MLICVNDRRFVTVRRNVGQLWGSRLVKLCSPLAEIADPVATRFAIDVPRCVDIINLTAVMAPPVAQIHICETQAVR